MTQAPDWPLTPPALARTYSPRHYTDGWEAVDQYLLVTEWAELNPRESWYTAAKALDLPKGRLESWYKGNKPQVVEQIEIADAYGWFDATWESPVGYAFNLLIAAVLSGGTLTTKFWVSVMRDEDIDPATEEALHEAIRVLVGSSTVVHEDDPHRATTIEPEQHGALLGRALHVLGVPRGRKTVSDLALPKHLFTASDDLRRDFVELYVILRGSMSEKGNIDMREERSQEYLESLGTLIEDVTGETATVRTNGVFLPKATVEKLDGTVVWTPPE